MGLLVELDFPVSNPLPPYSPLSVVLRSRMIRRSQLIDYCWFRDWSCEGAQDGREIHGETKTLSFKVESGTPGCISV